MASDPSPLRVAGLLGTLVALTVIGSSAVAVAIPVIAAELDLDTSGSAWILAAFSLTFAVSTAAFGSLADLRGLRLPLRVGAVAFAAGSLVAAAAPGFTVLVLGRLLQGAGAGAVPVVGVGIVAARFDEAARGRALGAMTAVVAAVSGAGPLIGGGLAELLGWRAVLALPALALLLTEPVVRLAPPSSRAPGGFDVRGAALTATGVTGLVLLLQSPATGAGVAAAIAFGLLLAGGAAGLAAHVARRPDGFLPRAVLANLALVRVSLAGLTLLAAYLGMMLAVPALLTAARGWSPLQVGLAMLPAAATGAVVSRLAGSAAVPERRARLVAALACGSAAGLLLAAALPEAPLALVGGLALVASAFGGGQVALIASVPGLVAPEHRGVALGLFNLLFFVGGAVGSATVGGLSVLLPLHGALAVLAALPLVGAALVVRTGRPRTAG